MGRDTLGLSGRVAHQLIGDNDVVSLEDGYYVYWPSGFRGFLDSHSLRGIADFVDWLNEPWEKRMKTTEMIFYPRKDNDGLTS